VARRTSAPESPPVSTSQTPEWVEPPTVAEAVHSRGRWDERYVAAGPRGSTSLRSSLSRRFSRSLCRPRGARADRPASRWQKARGGAPEVAQRPASTGGARRGPGSGRACLPGTTSAPRRGLSTSASPKEALAPLVDGSPRLPPPRCASAYEPLAAAPPPSGLVPVSPRRSRPFSGLGDVVRRARRSSPALSPAPRPSPASLTSRQRVVGFSVTTASSRRLLRWPCRYSSSLAIQVEAFDTRLARLSTPLFPAARAPSLRLLPCRA